MLEKLADYWSFVEELYSISLKRDTKASITLVNDSIIILGSGDYCFSVTSNLDHFNVTEFIESESWLHKELSKNSVIKLAEDFFSTETYSTNKQLRDTLHSNYLTYGYNMEYTDKHESVVTKGNNEVTAKVDGKWVYLSAYGSNLNGTIEIYNDISLAFRIITYFINIG